MNKIIWENKKLFKFELIKSEVAGIVLKGIHTSWIRKHNFDLTNAFIIFHPLIIKNFCFHGKNVDLPLLLTKAQEKKMSKMVEKRGLTCLPQKIFQKNGMIKIEIVLVKILREKFRNKPEKIGDELE